MHKPIQICPSSIQPGEKNDPLYALQDFLEMRVALPDKKRSGLLEQLRRHLDLSGDVHSLPAFMVGGQAVLFIQEDMPASYWVYNPAKACLNLWKNPAQTAEGTG
jgi:hypothetical protein